MTFPQRKINNKTDFINRRRRCDNTAATRKCRKKRHKIFDANIASSYRRVPSGVGGGGVDRISREKNE